MRVLLDLNIILDVLLDRAPHAGAAAALWSAIEGGEAEGRLSAHAVTTLHYVASRARGAAFGEQCVRDVTSVFSVSPVDGAVVTRALALQFSDFEDAVTAAAAEADGCGMVVSRDHDGFRRSPVAVLDARAALTAIRVRDSHGGRGAR
jgi:predicted nucleic acid-binding protein